jgi:hypothetical protein
MDEPTPQNIELLMLVPRDIVVTLTDGTPVKLPVDENTTVLNIYTTIVRYRVAHNIGTEWVMVSSDEAEVLTMSSATLRLLEVCPQHRSFFWRSVHRRFLPGPHATWQHLSAAESAQRSLFLTLARSFAEDIVLSPGHVCLPVDLWAERMPVPHQQIKTQVLEWLSDLLAKLRFVAGPQRSAELETLKVNLNQIADHLATLLASRSSVGASTRPAGHVRTPSATPGPSSLKEIQQRPITVASFLIGVQNFVNAMCSFLEVYRPWSNNAGEGRRLFSEVLELIDRIVVRGFMLDDIFLHVQKFMRRSVEEML